MDHIIAGQRKILVMDGEKDIREIIKIILTEDGHDVEIVGDGLAAVKRYTKANESGQPFDVVILDSTLPGPTGGFEAIKELLKIDPDIKAVASNDRTGNLAVSKHRKYGFKGVLGKPFAIMELSETVDNVLKGKYNNPG